MREVIVTGSFDNMDLRDVRFLEEASRLGRVRVELRAGDMAGRTPRFPAEERLYFLRALRWVDEAGLCRDTVECHALPDAAARRDAAWVVRECDEHPGKRQFCAARGMKYVVVPDTCLSSIPAPASCFLPPGAGRKKVVVTGCFDWFHSGHVRFFEEVSALGDLYVLVGHDANIRLLKGDGHPMFPQENRRYMTGAVRFVHQALVTSGSGWLDAEPEMAMIRPDIYAVNEDGDRPEKRDFCGKNDIEYVVLKREPSPGLPRRSSTDLRGF